MSRTIKFALIGLAVLLLGAGIWPGLNFWWAHEGRAREASYAETLKAYQASFPIGTPRQAVESSLKARGVTISRIKRCCSPERVTSDEIQIGSYPVGFPCGDTSVVIILDYEDITEQDESSPVDKLLSVSMERHQGPCL